MIDVISSVTYDQKARLMTIDQLIQAEIGKNTSIPHLLAPNHEWWGLTEAEEEIFRIDRDNWPRLLAIWTSYEAVLNIAHHEWLSLIHI